MSTLNAHELRSVQVGDATHSEAVPTFVEALHLLRHPPTCSAGARAGRRAAHCFAEIKSEGLISHGFDPRLTEASAAAVVDAGVTRNQLTWISFSLEALKDMKRRLPEFSALHISYVQTASQAWATARLAVASGMDGININANPQVISAELVDWLHARGKKIGVWVWRAPASNDVARVWEHMARCGVDYFTSNIPPELVDWAAMPPPAMPTPAAG